MRIIVNALILIILSTTAIAQQQLTLKDAIRIALHKNSTLQKNLNNIETFESGVQSAWGNFLCVLMKTLFTPFRTIKPADVDIVLDNNEFSLADYGIAGKVIYTPGHSSGSVSVLLDTGEAFVGDLAMNTLPMKFSPGLPVFGRLLNAAITFPAIRRKLKSCPFEPHSPVDAG